MIRPILTEIAVFLIPFAAYALFLYATRAGVLAPQSWPPRVVIPLSIVAVVLLISSLALLVSVSGSPPGGTYVPAHIEDGKIVPGREVFDTKASNGK